MITLSIVGATKKSQPPIQDSKIQSFKYSFFVSPGIVYLIIYLIKELALIDSKDVKKHL